MLPTQARGSASHPPRRVRPGAEEAREAEAQAICMEDPNFHEAFKAFQAKRDTKFA